jgi:hypothetical protein
MRQSQGADAARTAVRPQHFFSFGARPPQVDFSVVFGPGHILRFAFEAFSGIFAPT